MVDILARVLQHDEQAVLSVVDMALKSGVPTKTHLLNLLHRLVDGKSFTPPTLHAPQALTLTTSWDTCHSVPQAGRCSSIC